MVKEDLKDRNILFFDGICHLCNSFVDSLITQDKTHIFQFAPLQGETAQLLLNAQDRNSLESVVYFEAGTIFRKSDAVLKVLTKFGGAYLLLHAAWILPRFIRDGAYGFVAKRRYKWFGEREFCRLPTPEERAYLLP